jgi:hypothetical protein
MTSSYRGSLFAAALLLCQWTVSHAQSPAPGKAAPAVPYANEIIVKGVAETSDAHWAYLTIDATDIKCSDGTYNRFPGARHKNIVVDDKTQIFDFNHAAKSLTDIAPGTVVTVVGNDAGVGAPMKARTITLSNEPDYRPQWRRAGYKLSAMNEKLLREAKSGEPKQIVATVKAGADINAADSHGHTALWYALSGRNLGTFKWLLGRGADVDLSDEDGNTVLAHATRAKAEPFIKLLVAAGAK